MKAPTIIAIALALLYIIIQTGLSMKSEDQIIEDTKTAAENAFKDKGKIEANQKIDSFSFYLPSNLEVTEEDPNNIILSNGNQLYIVFSNKLEDATSELNYDAAMNEKALLLESFRDETKFGYVRVLPEEDKSFELQVGVGGVKITTYTSKMKMEKDADELMKIARSIALPN